MDNPKRQKMVRFSIIILAIFFLLILFTPKSKNSQENQNTQINQNILSTEKETEIYYRFAEIFDDITQKEGLDPLPELNGKKNPTPKKDKAEKLTAEEYSISIENLNEILDKVQKSKPSEEELNIFQIYDNELNKAIDMEANGGEKIDENKIRSNVASSLNISEQRLKNIWNRVYSWQQSE